jgi:8-amino-3,8-dideoxy-alpha-D-manno-octulosonate transaminase
VHNGHWEAKEFEAAFASRLQTKHCQLVSSGTAALKAALAEAGIGAGDEVMMPSFTFLASFESRLMLGAIPVLVNIEDTLGLDPAEVESAITPNIKCIVPVHMSRSISHLAALKKQEMPTTTFASRYTSSYWRCF